MVRITPIFFNHLGTYDRHGYYPLTKWDDPPSRNLFLGGGLENIFGIFIPKIVEDEPILTHIFQLG